MTDFLTSVELPHSVVKISLQTPLLLVGSCFSDEVGKLLLTNKFKVLANPFGVIFNPLAAMKLLQLSLVQQDVNDTYYLQHQEVWYNYLLHSNFSSLEFCNLKEAIKKTFQKTYSFLHSPQTKFLLMTFGTAWVYHHKGLNFTVANCHKQPAQLFEKRLLGVEEIVENFVNLYQLLPPKTQVILTVSPVRHQKDTLPLNTVSKSVLLLACYKICKKIDNIQYFPSYELIIDELRDYRFFMPDYIHPTPQAVQYVFEKFQAVYFDENANKFIAKWNKILQQLQHTSFHPTTTAHQKFLRNLLGLLEELRETVDVEGEIEKIRGQLVSK